MGHIRARLGRVKLDSNESFHVDTFLRSGGRFSCDRENVTLVIRVSKKHDRYGSKTFFWHSTSGRRVGGRVVGGGRDRSIARKVI